MDNQWELPKLLNQTSKKKYNSISPEKQADTKLTNKYAQTPSGSHLLMKNRKPHFSQFHLSSKGPGEMFRKSQHPYRKKLQNMVNNKGKQNNQSQMACARQQQFGGNLTQSAFHQLQIFLARYFKEESSDELLNEKQKLSKIIKHSKKLLKSVLKLTNDREVIFLDEAISIIFHEFKAEIALTQGSLQTALYHFARAQYYSLKQNLLLFAIYSLRQQAQIQREKGELQLELQCLKKALSLSIQVQRQDVASTILQKIGVTYYYHGNTVMGEYFHLFSERGLTKKEADLYGRQLNLGRYLKMLKQKLFGIRQTPIDEDEWKCKEIDLNTLNNQMQTWATENQHFKNIQIVSEMLKDNRTRLIGQKLQSQMLNTMKVAKIHPFKNLQSKSENQTKELPLINVSRVLKSHLSLNRQVIGQSKRQWQLSRLQQMIRS